MTTPAPASTSIVLLVEDDPAHAELIERALAAETSAHTLHHVRDGEAALEYLEGHYAIDAAAPRAVLLDLRVPRLGGLEVLARIRSHDDIWATPVVVLSSSRAERDVTEAYRHGANGYLVKPISFTELRAMMKAFSTYWLEHNRPLAPPPQLAANQP